MNDKTYKVISGVLMFLLTTAVTVMIWLGATAFDTMKESGNRQYEMLFQAIEDVKITVREVRADADSGILRADLTEEEFRDDLGEIKIKLARIEVLLGDNGFHSGP